ncbi:hypothetical protein AN639_02480 [Candidatus Epulonipiscium fishelsonii]|uniref:Uncharacterized protein n=1 Tax=Candidatus Epulonipiscium fishelsonii TaxID=77094 RepID=A0ACC8XB65_9FIRM|nr:hypothetical protein AN396_07720 [Epulopiscium sp. SCG-B11WGA-EpuloA1]ONI41994.1 hypothetical protein AN639_02480 [Epulopiscium sp. SCG-B05WGA-EpuloA1]
MRLAFVGCSIFSREIGYSISKSKNLVHSFFLEQGLHNTPDILRQTIQDTINKIEEIDKKEKSSHGEKRRGYDAIIIGYGLCSNGVVGLTSSRLPIVIPRCDDCMALFLGSQEKYLDLFQNSSGIYWYSKPWMENGVMPCKEYFQKLYEHYLQEYEDEDTAQYLVEQESGYITQYSNLYFIKSSIYEDEQEAETAKQIAKEFEWEYNEAPSSMAFISSLVEGDWDDRFLVCNPGQKVAPEYTGLKIKAENV